MHAAAFEVGHPLLIVPPEWHGGSFDHVVVAWSGSDASDRAVDAAKSWLTHASKVTVLRIGDDSEPDERLKDAFGLGGVPVSMADRARDEGVTIGAQIGAEADGLGADLLVAGAYRHAAIVEWLLGSTTRHLIAAARCPLFVIH